MIIKHGLCTALLLAGVLWGFSDPTFRFISNLTHLTFAKEKSSLILTVVYDNYSFDHRLKAAWGFSCLVEGKEKTILFDTGGDGGILLSNIKKLGIEPDRIDIVILSHIHGDHTGGLSSFLAINPGVKVYLPQSFPESFKDSARELGAGVTEVKDSLKICKDVYSTGEMGGWIKEQSLVVKTTKGLVVITGCAHPGITNIIQKAKEMIEDEVYLVLGGFHLSGVGKNQLNKIIQEFKNQEVKKVAPCHCSGNLTRDLFKKAYGEDLIPAGVGKKILVEDQQDYS